MNWTPQQAAALEAVARWFNDPRGPQVFRVFGWAGTGKTTLARHFAEGVGEKVYAAAYTGKAAHVLTSKGLPASTIHSLAYKPKSRSNAGARDLENQLTALVIELMEQHECAAEDDMVVLHPQYIEIHKKLRLETKNANRPLFDLNTDSVLFGARLLILDECSQVDETMGHDLDSFGCKILVLGDPFQLPPVGGAGYYTNKEPDVMLTDIRRQAHDNPIISLSAMLRDRRMPAIGRYGETEVMDRSRMTPDLALAADQLLVGRNATRHATNKRVRTLLGRSTAESTLPVQDDRLVCLRNNRESGLLNGSLWRVSDVGTSDGDRITMVVDSIDLDGRVQAVTAHTHYFEGRGDKLPWYEKSEAEEFDFGYALTVHKAQGSQWDDVTVFDESSAFRDMRWRWLYTGVTRAAEKLTLVLGM